MQVHSARSSISVENLITEQASTTKPNTASPEDLKSLITQRSEDLLVRMLTHGTLQQKSLASSTYNALAMGSFIHNPVTKHPVRQFGTDSKLEGQAGTLLVNFTIAPNGDADGRLDLAAIGFQEKRHFNLENGRVVIVPLLHAKDLEEVKLSTRLGDTPSRGNGGAEKSLPEAQMGRSVALSKQADPASTRSAPTQATAAEVAKAKQSGGLRATESGFIEMQKLMANKLVQERIAKKKENGIEAKESPGQLISAHATLLYKQTLNLGRKALPSKPTSYKATPILPEKKIPEGLEYEFPKKSFENFYEEYLENPEIKLPPKAPNRRAGVLMNSQLIAELNKELGANTSTEPVTPNIETRRASTESLDKISQVSSADDSENSVLREYDELKASKPENLRKALAKLDEEELMSPLEQTRSDS